MHVGVRVWSVSHGFGHKVRRLETCDLEGSWFGTLRACLQSPEQSYVLNGIRTNLGIHRKSFFFSFFFFSFLWKEDFVLRFKSILGSGI